MISNDNDIFNYNSIFVYPGQKKFNKFCKRYKITNNSALVNDISDDLACAIVEFTYENKLYKKPLHEVLVLFMLTNQSLIEESRTGFNKLLKECQ